jgi:hypothetical protein
MPKPQLKWIVTANFTAEGSVAYFKADRTFSRALADAQVFATKEEAEEARLHALSVEAEVADPYLTEVADGSQGALDVLTARERIRSQGPTVHYGHRGTKTSQA